MSVLGISVATMSTDHDAAVRRYESLLGPPRQEFAIRGTGLTVTVFAGLSVLSGAAAELASVKDLRATMFVESLPETQSQIDRMGWTIVGSLAAGESLLARDPDGILFEFVEQVPTSSKQKLPSKGK
jgi:hypothetical protein